MYSVTVKWGNMDAGVTLYFTKLLFWATFLPPEEEPGSEYGCKRLFTVYILFEKEFHTFKPNNELIMMGLMSVGQNCCF